MVNEVQKDLCNTYFEYDAVTKLMQSNDIREVRVFSLGPYGTNIAKASRMWAQKNHIKEKTNIVLCDSPEDEIAQAMQVTENGVLPIFALCAVYYDLCKLFFRFGSNYTFLHHFYMPLDRMQLASKDYDKDTLPNHAKVASHYSPSILLEQTDYEICLAKSNAAAAKKCALGEADACITTETAKELYQLKTIREFGAPSMLFTFGTTSYGIDILEQLQKQI